MSYDEREFWDSRYRNGLTSGPGSAGAEAAWKVAQVVALAKAHKCRTVLDLGHGDGELARAFMAELPRASYRGVDIAPSAIDVAHAKAAPRMSFEVADFTAQDFDAQADLVVCLDVLFHLSTQDKHDAAVVAICRSFRKVAVVAAWNEGIVAEYGGKFCAHTFFRPFVAPPGIRVTETTVPGLPVKTLFVLTRG